MASPGSQDKEEVAILHSRSFGDNGLSIFLRFSVRQCKILVS